MENDKKYLKVDTDKYRKVIHDMARLATALDNVSYSFHARLNKLRENALLAIKNGKQ